MAWAERCLAPGARVVGAARLGGPTGPWLLRRPTLRRRVLRRAARAGDPHSVNDRHRFGVESAALDGAEQFQHRCTAPHRLRPHRARRLATGRPQHPPRRGQHHPDHRLTRSSRRTRPSRRVADRRAEQRPPADTATPALGPRLRRPPPRRSVDPLLDEADRFLNSRPATDGPEPPRSR